MNNRTQAVKLSRADRVLLNSALKREKKAQELERRNGIERAKLFEVIIELKKQLKELKNEGSQRIT